MRVEDLWGEEKGLPRARGEREEGGELEAA